MLREAQGGVLPRGWVCSPHSNSLESLFDKEGLERFRSGGRNDLAETSVRRPLFLDSRLRGNDSIWGAQRGDAPLRFFIIPQEWGMQGLKSSQRH